MDLILEWLGYLLTPGNRYKKFLSLVGVPDSGKSVQVDFMTAFLGSKNVSNLSLELLCDKFEAFGLIGKLLNISSEVRYIEGKVEEQVKKITGGDRLLQPVKGEKEAVEYLPTCRLVMVGNHDPRFQDSSDAIWRRGCFVHFPRSLTGQPMNLNLRTQLLAERSGVLNLALIALARLHRRGQFTQSDESDRIVQRCRLTSNPLKMFVEECFILADGATVPRHKVMSLYSQFAKAWHFQGAHSRESIFAEIRRLCPSRENQPGNERMETFDKGKESEFRDRVFVGLSVNTDAEKLIARSQPVDPIGVLQRRAAEMLNTIAEENWKIDDERRRAEQQRCGLQAREERLAKREANPLAHLRKEPKGMMKRRRRLQDVVNTPVPPPLPAAINAPFTFVTKDNSISVEDPEAYYQRIDAMLAEFDKEESNVANDETGEEGGSYLPGLS